jgi:hypothetical protein
MCGVAAAGARYYRGSSPLLDVRVQQLSQDTEGTNAFAKKKRVLVKLTAVSFVLT